MIKKITLALLGVLFMVNVNAALVLKGEFNEYNINSFVEEINEEVKKIEDKKLPKIIQIDFESPGGSIFAGLSLLNRIDELKLQGYKFEGRVKRYCASMCFISFQAMHNRIMYPYALLLDHPASGGSNLGTLIEFEAPLKEMAYKRLKGSRYLYNRLVANEYFMNAKSALGWGLVDKIGILDFTKAKKDEKPAKNN